MINFIAITLLVLGTIVDFKNLKRKKRQIIVPPTIKLPS